MILPILTTLITAELSARDDFEEINGNVKIHHVIQWCIRAAIVGTACLADWYWFNAPWRTVIGMAGLFSAFFRWRLNSLRGKDWRYVSPSSYYDRFWLRCAACEWQSVGELEYYFTNYYGGNTHYIRENHRAGLIAYIVELVVFAVVLWLHVTSH